MDKSSKSHYRVEGAAGIHGFANRNTAIDYAVEVNAKNICFYEARDQSLVDISPDMARVWVDNFKAENNNEMPAIFPNFVTKFLPNPQPPMSGIKSVKSILGLGAPLASVHMPLPPLRAPKNIEHATLMLDGDKAKLEDELAAAKARVFEFENKELLKKLSDLCQSLFEITAKEHSFFIPPAIGEKFYIRIEGKSGFLSETTSFVPHEQSSKGLVAALEVLLAYQVALDNQHGTGAFERPE